jgi:hypothetical protein
MLKSFKVMLALVLLSSAAGYIPAAHASGSALHQFELSTEDYIRNAFGGNVPAAERVWVRGQLKQTVEQILQHKSTFLRAKYWQLGQKSVWVLDEIGKDKPITVGITVLHEGGKSTLLDVKVLAFRESRGWEIKHDFFTRQFIGLGLLSPSPKPKLDNYIDGITGATLSVRALKKLAKIALTLDQFVRQTDT